MGRPLRSDLASGIKLSMLLVISFGLRSLLRRLKPLTKPKHCFAGFTWNWSISSKWWHNMISIWETTWSSKGVVQTYQHRGAIRAWQAWAVFASSTAVLSPSWGGSSFPLSFRSPPVWGLGTFLVSLWSASCMHKVHNKRYAVNGTQNMVHTTGYAVHITWYIHSTYYIEYSKLNIVHRIQYAECTIKCIVNSTQYLVHST